MPRIRPDAEVRQKFLEKLATLDQRYADLEKRLSDPDTIANSGLFTKLVKEHGTLTRTVDAYRRLKKTDDALAGARRSSTAATRRWPRWRAPRSRT